MDSTKLIKTKLRVDPQKIKNNKDNLSSYAFWFVFLCAFVFFEHYVLNRLPEHNLSMFCRMWENNSKIMFGQTVKKTVFKQTIQHMRKNNN